MVVMNISGIGAGKLALLKSQDRCSISSGYNHQDSSLHHMRIYQFNPIVLQSVAFGFLSERVNKIEICI